MAALVMRSRSTPTVISGKLAGGAAIFIVTSPQPFRHDVADGLIGPRGRANPVRPAGVTHRGRFGAPLGSTSLPRTGMRWLLYVAAAFGGKCLQSHLLDA